MTFYERISVRRWKASLPAAFWPLADQAVVSVGSFVANLVMARALTPQDYGSYSLLFMSMLQLQLFTGALLYYPLAVRGAVMTRLERANLFGAGLAMLLVLCVPLCLVLGCALVAAGRLEVAGPAILWLVLWQVQELLRRCLFAEFRHNAAVPGDALRYLGQAAGLVGLSAFGGLTLLSAVSTMAATCALGIILQAFRVAVKFDDVRDWPGTARLFWRIGSRSLGSNVLTTLSTQMFPWLLAVSSVAMTAYFQASLNLVMAANPLLIGLCNIIPQSVALHRRDTGMDGAWRSCRRMMLLGAIPVIIYYIVVLFAPHASLTLLYGHASPYLGLSFAVRALAVAAIFGFVVEIVNAFLHGIEAAGLAMKINAVGFAVAVVVGVPMTLSFGLEGSCVTIAIASIARSTAAFLILTSVLSHARVQHA